MTGLPLALDARTTALLVVDMQNDFCHPEGHYGRVGPDITGLKAAIEPTRALIERARAAGMPVVFTRIVRDTAHGPVEQRHHLKPRRWFSSGDRLMPGTWGAEVLDALAPLPGELVVDKHGYSAFHETTLERHLKDRGVSTLLLTGVVTYACVLATCFAAHDRGFDVVMVEDAVGTWNEGLGRSSFEIVDLLLGWTVNSAEIVIGAKTAAA